MEESPEQDGSQRVGHELLTDEELREGGLTKVSAWIRSEISDGTLRKQRSRSRQLDKGLKQLNVTVSEREEVRTAVREICKRVTVEPDAAPVFASLSSSADALRVVKLVMERKALSDVQLALEIPEFMHWLRRLSENDSEAAEDQRRAFKVVMQSPLAAIVGEAVLREKGLRGWLIRRLLPHPVYRLLKLR